MLPNQILKSLFIVFIINVEILESYIKLFYNIYLMKFLTIAALCAFAASVSSLKIESYNSHLREDYDHDQTSVVTPQSTNTDGPVEQDSSSGSNGKREDSQRGKGGKGQRGPKGGKGGKGEKGGKGKGKGGKGKNFDWSTFQSPCTKQDNACWKKWFETQVPCKAEDKKCMKQAVQKLPCPLMDKKCWTDNISTFPCTKQDNTCWDSILPSTLPCKSGDQECWKKVNQQNKKGDKGEKGGKGGKGDKGGKGKKPNHDLQDYLASIGHDMQQFHDYELQHDEQFHYLDYLEDETQ